MLLDFRGVLTQDRHVQQARTTPPLHFGRGLAVLLQNFAV
jgi:hypothetical protein